MSHKSMDDLKASEERLVERLKEVRAAIRAREVAAMTRLAKTYAKAIATAAKAGAALPTPEQLVALLGKPDAPAQAKSKPKNPDAPAPADSKPKKRKVQRPARRREPPTPA